MYYNGIDSQKTSTALFVVAAIMSFLIGCSGGTPANIASDPPPLNANASAPRITTVSPNSVVAGSAAFTLTVSGVNFVSGSTVNFAGAPLTTAFVSTTQLTAVIPASAIALGGVATISVTNPAPGGASNGVSFGITNPPPQISSLSPDSAPGGTGFTLTINGANFVPGSGVNFGNFAPAVTFVSSSQLTAAIPSSAVPIAGTTAVAVFNPSPGGGVSNVASFIVGGSENPAPVVSSLGPSCAAFGGAAFTLLVYGTDFLSNSVVRWNGSDLLTTPTYTVSGTIALTAEVSAAEISKTGIANITVFNPPPGGGSSAASRFSIAAGGVAPQSIAIDATGKFAYVANEFGCADAVNGRVSIYTIDATTGALTPVEPALDSNDEGSRSVAVDASGKLAYVANWGEGDTAGSISAYSIDATSGALTSTAMIYGFCPGLCAPWSVAVHPSGKFVYVADEGSFAPTGISMYSVSVATGALTSTGTVAAGGRAIWMAIHPTGKFAYVANSSNSSPGEGNSISMFLVDTNTGALTSIGTIAAGSNPTSIGIDPLGKFAYVTNSDSSNVSMFMIDATSGTLKSIGLVTAGIAPVAVAVDPRDKFAYVANSQSNDVCGYTIDPTSGALVLIGTVAAGTTPSSIAIHPSGKFAYVTNSGSNDISIYSIDAANGALTLIATIGT